MMLSIFSYVYLYLYVSFEVSVQIFCPFLNQVVLFLLKNYKYFILFSSFIEIQLTYNSV